MPPFIQAMKNPFAGLFAKSSLQTTIKDEIYHERSKLQNIEGLIDQLELEKALSEARIKILADFFNTLHKRNQNEH